MKNLFFQLGLAVGLSATFVLGTSAQEPEKAAEPQKSVITKPAADAPKPAAETAKPAAGEDGPVQSPSDLTKPKPKPETPITPVTEPAPAAQPAPTAAAAPCATGTCPVVETVTTKPTNCCKCQSKHRLFRRSR